MPILSRRVDRPANYLALMAFVIAAATASHPAFGQIAPAPTVRPGAVAPVRPILNQPPLTVAPVAPPALRGFVDLHAHLMTHLGFGGKLIYGGVDAGSLVPIDRGGCQYIRAANESDALNQENMAHGGWGLDNGCGDVLREQFIHLFQANVGGSDPRFVANDPPDSSYKSSGPPNFATWPAWNDLTRQRMWVDWIRRSYNGGLRVMVALATNNKLFGDLTRGQGDLADDDQSSADLQISEIKDFAARHSDFMAIAYNSSELYSIVSANKLAIVLGVEIDQIGNFVGTASAAQLMGEVDRLYAEGVRYIFPIHISDNALGGTAAYEDTFALVTKYENGNWWYLGCSGPLDNINYVFGGLPAPRGFGAWVTAGLGVAALSSKLGVAKVQEWGSMPGKLACPAGNVNQTGLTQAGELAIQQMMRHGMLIDIDHMSQNSANNAIYLAQHAAPGGYPLNSGHNHIRGFFPGEMTSERNFTPDTYAAIGSLHGMAGVGSAKLDADQWLRAYNAVVNAMGGPTKVAAGFGTDMNGLEFAMPPRSGAAGWPPTWVPGPQYAQYEACLKGPQCPCTPQLGPNGKPIGACINTCLGTCRPRFPNGEVLRPAIPPTVQYSAAFPESTDDNAAWNYATVGVAHYGMLPDFIQDVVALGGGAMVQNNLMSGADYFFHTWQISETRGAQIK
jgi:microsomal dipeptidase-like Zn-dependent dipeptidase